MRIACDEAGHTGPDLLAKDQRYFAFASVNIGDDEASALIQEARKLFPVQMPELKASKLMSSPRGRQLIAHLIRKLSGRFAINAHDKLFALCGWVFEYIFEPVYQDDPRIFYRKQFHRFIAMFCYLWSLDSKSEAPDFLLQFQNYMRSKDPAVAPLLFEYKGGRDNTLPRPFELVQIFATGFRDVIAADNSKIVHRTSDKGQWTLDLSASSLWSHLSHWGKQKTPLAVICDDSKPLRAIANDLTTTDRNGIAEYIKNVLGLEELGWEFATPLQFIDSRAHPSVQLADILASTVTYCYSRGTPDDMQATVKLLDEAMLRESIFPDMALVDLKQGPAQVNYAVLYELAVTAQGRGTGLPVELFYEITEDSVTSGMLSFE